MKLLILGHGRHGKDTVAEIMRYDYGLKFVSSSEICTPIARKWLADYYDIVYSSNIECFNDRHNHRTSWANAISSFNMVDRTKLTRMILHDNDIYVGMRKLNEYTPSVHLFDYVLYVDALIRIPYRDPTMEIPFDILKMARIDNNGDLDDLRANVEYFMRYIGIPKI